MVKILTETNIRRPEYDQYLSNHILNVKNSWNNILYPALLTESDLTVEDFTKISKVIDDHDKSKYEDEEYYAYLNYFYPTDDNPKDEDEFNKAWLHHQRVNPHHWQYHVLIKDSGELIPLDMPIEYICEMLCDWHSSSATDPESTAYKWYQDNKDKMLLSNNTRKIVEKYINYLKDSLSDKDEI